MSRIIRCACTLVLAAMMVPAVGHAASQPITIATVAENMPVPHAMAILPQGDILIAEKNGRIDYLKDGHVAETPAAIIPQVFMGDLSGLQDIVLDPNFAENQRVYISYQEGTGAPWTFVIATAKFADGTLHDLTKIFTVAPNGKEDLWGGYIAFLRDGTMLVTIADGGDTKAWAQRTDSLLGKVLRLDKDGKVPSDNPFVGVAGKRPEIFTLGHRHAIGILYDAVQDVIYENENGPWGGDEVNVLQPGKNYGWPLATYGMDYDGAYVSPYQSYPGTEQPILYWTPSIAPSGMAQCRKCQWPEWEGNLFVGALAGRKVMRVEVNGAKVLNQEPLFEDLHYRIRDVDFGPDGALYVLTDEPRGRLLRVTRGQPTASGP